MKKYILIIIFISLNIITVISSTGDNDSLYSGKVCYLILINGFESDGIITLVKDDTIWFRNEYTEYRVPVSHIKSVNRYAEDEEEYDYTYYGPDTSAYCDIYLGSGSKLVDVRLLLVNDSALYFLKWKTKKQLKVEDVRKIEFTGSNFGDGFLTGAGFGLGLSLIYTLTASQGSATFSRAIPYCFSFSVFTGLLGGLISSIANEHETYFFNKGYSGEKYRKLKYITIKHKF